MTIKKYNQKLGGWGEELAAQFLIKKGYEVLDRNLRNHCGEIDLICKKDDNLIFVEVKTRTNKNFGRAEEAVSVYKQKKVRRTIEKYLSDHEDAVKNLSPSFDVVVVEIFGVEPQIIHFENVELANLNFDENMV